MTLLNFQTSYLLSHTGMRCGEVISLRGRDVEIEGEGMIVSGRVEGGDYQEQGSRRPVGAGCAVPLPAGEPTSLLAQG